MRRAFWATAVLLVTLLAPKVAIAATEQNLIANPSAETIGAQTGLPTDWVRDRWGTNSCQFATSNDAVEGTTSLMVTVASYTSGDAKWYFTPVDVTAGTTYVFSDYYKSTVASTICVRYTSATGVLSYVWLGASPAAATWTRCSYAFTPPAGTVNATVFHLIKAVGTLMTDDFHLLPPPPTPPADTTPPTVAFASPSAGTTLTGTVPVEVSASDDVEVSQVALAIDGVPLGALTAPPYRWSLDTSNHSNGTHTLVATVTDSSNNTATADIAVGISNAPPPPATNLVPNDSVEQATAGNAPVSWYRERWGKNVATFSYPASGYTGSRSLQVAVSQYTSGDARWYFAPQRVTPGAYYRYTDHYIATVDSHVVVALKSSTGAISYLYMQDAPASSGWAEYSTGFSVPPGMVTATVYHLLSSVGTLTTDEFSLVESPPPATFSRPIVSIDFDDGYVTDYSAALPLLKEYGLTATHYLISGSLGSGGYLSRSQVAALAARGDEIGSHTVTHPHLTQLAASQLTEELDDSRIALHSLAGTPVTTFAMPYGEYDDRVMDQVKTFYRSARTTEYGYNTPSNLDPYRIRVRSVESSTTTATVRSWVDTAVKSRYWLVLVYHRIDDAGGGATRRDDLDLELAYIKSKGVRVATMSEALDELKPQVVP